MKGVTQSYEMFDSSIYKKAKKMREFIIKENASIKIQTMMAKTVNKASNRDK